MNMVECALSKAKLYQLQRYGWCKTTNFMKGWSPTVYIKDGLDDREPHTYQDNDFDNGEVTISGETIIDLFREGQTTINAKNCIFGDDVYRNDSVPYSSKDVKRLTIDLVDIKDHLIWDFEPGKVVW